MNRTTSCRRLQHVATFLLTVISIFTDRLTRDYLLYLHASSNVLAGTSVALRRSERRAAGIAISKARVVRI